MKSFRLKQIIIATLFGTIISLILGLFENISSGIIGAKSYGYPFVWRTEITTMTTTINYNFSNLIFVILIWFSIAFIVLELIQNLRYGTTDVYDLKKPISLFAILFCMAIILCFIHEFGHIIFGTIAGGNLTYLQIGNIIFYPKFEMASNFQLGFVQFTGFTTSFEHGLFLLGGSLTSNIAALLIGFIIIKRELGQLTKNVLKIGGIIGLLDLPFYVFLPQIGLKHWIIIGGENPEPLIGASQMGISDFVFYLITFLITFILVLIYFQPIRNNISDKIRFLKKFKN